METPNKTPRVKGIPFGQHFVCDACKAEVSTRILYRDKDENEMSLCQRCGNNYNLALNTLYSTLQNTKFRPSI